MPASSCCTHRSDEVKIHHFFARAAFLCLVVPRPVVHQLPKQLERWLCPVPFWARHAQVVDEYRAPLSWRRSNQSPSSLLQLG